MAAARASRELFTEGVRAVLNTWPVLQIAVDNGFGGVYGQQKADWMVDVVQQFFHDNANLQSYEVENFIGELMDQEFDTVVDDGSLPQVSVRLLQMFSQCQQGALQQLQHTVNSLTEKKSERAKVTVAHTHSDEESDDDDDEDGTQAMDCSSSSTQAPPPQAQAPPPHAQATPPQAQAPPPPPSQDEDGWTVVRKKK